MNRAKKYIIDSETSKQILVAAYVFTRESFDEIEQKRIQRDSKCLNFTTNRKMEVSHTNVCFLKCFKDQHIEAIDQFCANATLPCTTSHE